MGNKIDCKYVCQQPELQQQHFLTHMTPLDQHQITFNMKKEENAHPRLEFAKPVSQVLSLNKKVREVYFLQSFTMGGNDNREEGSEKVEKENAGVKLGPYYIYSIFAYYDGEWINGKMHGRGVLYFDNGTLLEGTFYQGKLDSNQALLILPNGDFYKGIISNQKLKEFGQTQLLNQISFNKQIKNNLGNKIITKQKQKQSNSIESYICNKPKLKPKQKQPQPQQPSSMNTQIKKQSSHQSNQTSQLTQYSKISRPQPSNYNQTKDYSFKLPSEIKVANTESYFPRKHHFRNISATDLNNQNVNRSKLNTSLRIERLKSDTSKEKKRIKVVHRHKRGVSAYSDKY